MDRIDIRGGNALNGRLPISGAKNAALLAAAILGNKYPKYREAYEAFRAKQTADGEAKQDIEGA